MAKRDIVVIGSSAGGVYALQELVSHLPADFTGSVFVVQHVAPYVHSMLPDILARHSPVEVRHPQDGELIRPGCIYIAPPDHHILIELDGADENTQPGAGRILVRKGPKENRFRPSIDALFRSAAYNYGTRVVGVVLTGLLNDGTSGMWTINRLGGVTVVQQPDDALYSSMPESVLEYVDVDYVLPLADIAVMLGQITRETAPEPAANRSAVADLPRDPLGDSPNGSHQPTNVPDAVNNELNRIKTEVDVAAQISPFERGILSMGDLSPLTCPECSGVLVTFREGHLIRYRCHTGHSYTASTLLTDITRAIEDTMWQSVRGLEESIMLLDQAANQLTSAGLTDAAEPYRVRSAQALDRAHRIRDLIFAQENLSGDGATLLARDGAAAG